MKLSDCAVNPAHFIKDTVFHSIFSYQDTADIFRQESGLHHEFFQFCPADFTVFATGGIGGLYKHSTNYRHLTGDSLAIALNHNIKLQNIDYIQIHPTTLYSTKKGRRFLISESVRGEGAVLFNSHMERFVDELLPRDVVAKAIQEEMKKDTVLVEVDWCYSPEKRDIVADMRKILYSDIDTDIEYLEGDSHRNDALNLD